MEEKLKYGNRTRGGVILESEERRSKREKVREKLISDEPFEKVPTAPSIDLSMPSFRAEEEGLTIHIPWNESAISFASNQIKDWLEYAKQQAKED